MNERNVLKSALYSQLDLLDTSDAMIHLSQLESRLAEQVRVRSVFRHFFKLFFADFLVSHLVNYTVFVMPMQDAQHRDAMGLLRTAERSSLISEIHQLRGQLERINQTQPSECSLQELRDGGGGADGAAPGDRLLVEELKGELSQTKLELEMTLKAQHKHLKELDTLRSDVMS